MTKTSLGPRWMPSRLWSLCALVVVFLTGCATTQSAREASDPEVVEIGYGQIDREQVTGSVYTLSEEDMGGAQPQTLADMLARIPGVRVVQLTQLFSGFSVRVRGTTNSMVGGEEPLFVLDGMPISTGNGEIFSISPSVIESITVLRDGGATAIYGSRGANGVILIKLKSGGN